MKIFIVSTIVFLLILFFCMVPQWKAGLKKLFWINAVFLMAGYTYLVLRSFDVQPASLVAPFVAIVNFFTGGQVEVL